MSCSLYVFSLPCLICSLFRCTVKEVSLVNLKVSSRNRMPCSFCGLSFLLSIAYFNVLWITSGLVLQSFRFQVKLVYSVHSVVCCFHVLLLFSIHYGSLVGELTKSLCMKSSVHILLTFVVCVCNALFNALGITRRRVQ